MNDDLPDLELNARLFEPGESLEEVPAPFAQPGEDGPAEPVFVHKDRIDFESWYQHALALTGGIESERHKSRSFNLVQMLRTTSGLSGATLEAGCYRGLSSLLMCKAMRQADDRFDGTGHTMIDSFKGLSRPGKVDGPRAQAKFRNGLFRLNSIAGLRETIADFPGVEIKRGWIPQVFDNLPERRYRFVLISVGLFEPTLSSLRYFYPRMVDGGIVLVSGYGIYTNGYWPGCARAVVSYSSESGVPAVPMQAGNCILIKRAG
ncbi:MAG: TylF/MycF/NovP-related O-methyltransferase [Planctomycetota bacterium]